MKTLDIILLIPLVFGAVLGFRKGLLLEIFGVLAFVLAIIGGFKLMETGMVYLSEYFEDFDQLLPFISFLVIFLAIIILVNMLGKLLKKMIDLTLLGGFDKFAGAILGLVKWAIGVSILLWLVNNFGIELPGQEEELVLYPFLTELGPKLIASLDVVLPFAQEMLDSIKELLSPA
ncbi:CvpA family protein [Roseivirga spongicola]|uniref:Colicin v production protein n=1 Tax=Roseivirga spongicola TaxID=333140 RepID=A0A150XHH3_9BACT|nr:CvpA family protein [Roseivirga spongicola]KYG78144.1 colicin v production protein [Roseivirga spongicola]PWL30878.1 MAG: CvpA family protein [Roseivirga sp. XM-24bin3]WPZ11885.1 CvpA family protein [Roseivirga spongicola]